MSDFRMQKLDKTRDAKMNDCLVEIQELIVAELIEMGKLDDAQTSSLRITLKIQERFAKGAIYIPFDYQARNHEIKRRFNGKNKKQLAREFCLSERHISEIVKLNHSHSAI